MEAQTSNRTADDRHPFASPSIEFAKSMERGDAEAPIVQAILSSADAIFHELKCIRAAVENDRD